MTNEELLKHHQSLIISMVEDGASERLIAEKIGIPYSSFKRCKAKNVSLKDQMAQAKDKRTHAVELALYNNAVGFDYYEEVVTKVKEEVMADDGQTILVKENVKISKVKKRRLPDLAAQKFYLINRSTKEWQEDPNKVSLDKKNLKLKEKVVNNSIIEV